MLNGWKRIAAYLGRDERTAMRWAAERGLPVHRTPGGGRGGVYAIAEEIDTWFAADRERATPRPSAMIDVAAVPVSLSRASRRARWVRVALAAGGVVLAAVGAAALLHPMRGNTAVRNATSGFADPAARASFLQATYDWNLRTRDSLARATREYSDAIGRDPRVPSAYVGLANSYLLSREYGAMPEVEAYTRADAAARAAIALAPDSPDAHRALAFTAFWWWRDRDRTRDEFARAIALKRDDPLTHQWFATALMANGEPEAALREIDLARALDPTGTALLANRGLILYVAGRRAEGLNSLRALSRAQPDAVGPHRSLAVIALFEGRADEFLRESATAARLRGDAAGLADVMRWRSAGPSAAGVAAAMMADARARGDWFRVAQLAALAHRRDAAQAALGRACAVAGATTASAPGDLWLSRTLSRADVADRCGGSASLLP